MKSTEGCIDTLLPAAPVSVAFLAPADSAVVEAVDVPEDEAEDRGLNSSSREESFIESADDEFFIPQMRNFGRGRPIRILFSIILMIEMCESENILPHSFYHSHF